MSCRISQSTLSIGMMQLPPVCTDRSYMYVTGTISPCHMLSKALSKLHISVMQAGLVRRAYFSIALRNSWTTVSTRDPRDREPKEAPSACWRDLIVVPWLLMKPGGLKYHWAMVPEIVKTLISNTRKMLHSRVTLERVM